MTVKELRAYLQTWAENAHVWVAVRGIDGDPESQRSFPLERDGHGLFVLAEPGKREPWGGSEPISDATPEPKIIDLDDD